MSTTVLRVTPDYVLLWEGAALVIRDALTSDEVWATANTSAGKHLAALSKLARVQAARTAFDLEDAG